MFDAFHNKKVEYIVYDHSILAYHLEQGMIIDKNLHEEYLGFALANNFPYQEELSISILSYTDSSWWTATVYDYHNRREQ